MEWKIHHYLTMIVNVQVNWIKNLQFICKDFTILSSICMNLILRPFVSISKKKLQVDVNKRIKSRPQKHVIISLPWYTIYAIKCFISSASILNAPHQSLISNKSIYGLSFPYLFSLQCHNTMHCSELIEFHK